MQLTPIQELEAAIREHPAKAELYLQIAPLYVEKGRDYDAERLLAKGAAASGDPRVAELWEDLTLARLARNVALAEERVSTAGSPEARAELAKEQDERQRAEMAIFAKRCARNGEDARSRYELGRRYQAAGDLEAASGELKLALADKEFRSPAALALGDCQRQLKQIPAAMKHYRLAAAAAGETQIALKQQCLARAAELARQLKLPNLAERYVQEMGQ